jgi:hypothetical protein
MAGMVMLFVYFIPTIICWKKRNSKYLLILNIPLGQYWAGSYALFWLLISIGSMQELSWKRKEK